MSTNAQEFNAVLEEELNHVDARRYRRGLADDAPNAGPGTGGNDAASPPPLTDLRQQAHQRQLVGLAFSGGGIRSATFNLGFLQGLAGLKLVKYFDYLSTVSGGGYIGAWLVAWVQRRAAELPAPATPTAGGSPPPSAAKDVEDKLQPVEEQMAAATPKDPRSPDEPLDPIEHLRRHSNYLAPRRGFLSIDTWVLWALYLRNFLLNQLVLLPAAAIVLLLSRLVMFVYYPTLDADTERLYADYDRRLGSFPRVSMASLRFYGLLAVAVVATAIALISLIRAIHLVRQEKDRVGRPKNSGWLLGWVVAPVILAAASFCALIPNASPLCLSRAVRESQADKDSLSYRFVVGPSTPERIADDIKRIRQWPWWVADLALYMVFAALAIAVIYHNISTVASKSNRVVRAWCFLTGLVWGAMLYGAYRIIDWLYEWDGLEPWQVLQISATARMTALGPPILLLTTVLAISLAVGLLRKHMGEELREWYASLCARLLYAAVAWAVINSVALYGTALVLWAGPWVQFALGSGWLLTVAGGVLAGGGDGTDGRRSQGTYRDVFARLSLPVFVVGIFIIVSLLVHFAVDKPPEFDLGDESIAPSRNEPKYAPTVVSVERTAEKGKVTTERKTAYQRVTDEAAAIGQQYWLGMLNTGNIPRHDRYYLDDTDVDFLADELAVKRKLIDEEDLRVRLGRLQTRRRPWMAEEFRSSLKRYVRGLNRETEKDVEEVRREIFWLVAAQRSPTEIAAASTVGLLAMPVPLAMPMHHVANAPGLVLIPMPNVGRYPALPRRSLVPDATLQFDFDWEILSRLLPASSIRPSIKQKINEEHIQRQLMSFNYQVWPLEELEDEVDKVFPEAWNERVRKMIIQGVKGGTGHFINIDQGFFLSKIGAWLIGCVLVMLVAATQVNVNDFSLHGMYVNRLVRAYLGASRQPEPLTGADPSKRKPDPITGFDPNDDLLLSTLKSKDGQGYDGPVPVMNAAMNLAHGGNLAWQERKAESFIFTPDYCGSETTGYRTTDGRQPYGDGIKLGTAMAVSGAAASPNMGYHSSPAVTFLLTVFNARLGGWFGNPKHVEAWQYSGPPWGFLYLFRELFGVTDDASPYIYLSDGGHFENLGVYELIKRRCRYVVVCDAGQDEEHGFEDLGNLVRKVRIDHGISVEIAPDCLQLQKDSRHSRWHCAIGRIRYDEVDGETTVGTLVYVKPSLTGDEPVDVLHYAASHPGFPHETTANQFFTESQFESYRALGEHIAVSVFKESVDQDGSEVNDVGRPPGTGPADEGRDNHGPPGADSRDYKRQRFCRELFASLVRRWFAMPPNYDASFVATTHSFIDLHDAWRKDPLLWRLTLDVYPELDPDGSRAVAIAEEEGDPLLREIAEVHILLEMLQVAEDAYLSLNLEKYYAHPLNRGWMDVFFRWTSSRTFRKHWPTLRAEFGRDFVGFCERQIGIGEITGEARRLDRQSLETLPDRLLQEFKQEWPNFQELLKTVADGPGATAFRNVEELLNARHTFAWTIYPVPVSVFHASDRARTDVPGRAELPSGLIVVWPNDPAGVVEPKEYVMVMWQRGPYRNSGLGRPAIRSVLKELQEEIRGRYRLRVRLPAANLTGPGGSLQKSIWLAFFDQLNFVRTRPPRSVGQPSVLEMYRDFQGVPPPPAAAHSG
jgi:hypothetical protein